MLAVGSSLGALRLLRELDGLWALVHAVIRISELMALLTLKILGINSDRFGATDVVGEF